MTTGELIERVEADEPPVHATAPGKVVTMLIRSVAAQSRSISLRWGLPGWRATTNSGLEATALAALNAISRSVRLVVAPVLGLREIDHLRRSLIDRGKGVGVTS
jgi:hypothetical protein